MSVSSLCWTRRSWLTRNAAAALVATRAYPLSSISLGQAAVRTMPRRAATRTAAFTTAYTTERVLDDWMTLAQRAVEVARGAGAQYADAHLTRTVQHPYHFRRLADEDETVGVGVRALVNGYWGFAACPSGDTSAVEHLAQDAVAQATMNARGTPRIADLGRIPVAVGAWATPVEIDPFAISIEEKMDFIRYWHSCAERAGLAIDDLTSHLDFTRQERVIATSDGARFAQTCYESGGTIMCMGAYGQSVEVPVQRIKTAGRGWELFLDAKIPEQFPSMPAQIETLYTLQHAAKPATVGRYTLVCDGATMAALLDRTVGVATQLDRALGYEANAGGTSFLTTPLSMLGDFKVASPKVTITANRSAPTQLATVKWDDEGVVPEDFTLVKDGVLVDFQTTREQAAWLAPYYTKVGHPVRSHGCAATENALAITMQHMPNLALAPNPAAVRLDDLVADVKDGLLVTAGQVMQVDFQANTGLLLGQMREIKSGRLGRLVTNGAVLFNTLDLWRNVVAVGGISTQDVIANSQYPYGGSGGMLGYLVKGQPPQATSHSVQAVAATITNQAIIDPSRKA